MGRKKKVIDAEIEELASAAVAGVDAPVSTPPAIVAQNPIELAMPFTMPFAVEIALGYEAADVVCKRHGVSAEKFAVLAGFPLFKQTVSELAIAMHRDGTMVEVAAKLKMMRMLDRAETIAMDDETNRKEQIAAMEFVKDCSKPDKDAKRTSNNFVFNILNVAGAPSVSVSEGAKPVDAEFAVLDGDAVGDGEVESNDE